MGAKSEYYKDLKAKQKKKIDMLKKQLPIYVIPYLDEKELNSQMNTVISYCYDLIYFFEYLKEKNPLIHEEINKIPIEYLDLLTFEDINDYQKYLSFNDGENEHLNEEKSISQRLAPLRGFFTFACQHHYIKNNPTLGIAKMKKVKEKEIIRMNSNEVQNLLSEIEKNGTGLSSHQQKICEKTRLRDVAIITLMLNTGIRVSECVGLDIDDMNFEERSFVVLRKGGSSSILYFGDDVYNALSEYVSYERPNLLVNDEEKALFLSLKKQRITVRSVQMMIKKFSQIAVPDKKITPHKMRSTYGTALYRETEDIRLVADVLGHKDINTTAKHYAAIEDDHRKTASKITLYN